VLPPVAVDHHHHGVASNVAQCWQQILRQTRLWPPRLTVELLVKGYVATDPLCWQRPLRCPQPLLPQHPLNEQPMCWVPNEAAVEAVMTP